MGLAAMFPLLFVFRFGCGLVLCKVGAVDCGGSACSLTPLTGNGEDGNVAAGSGARPGCQPEK